MGAAAIQNNQSDVTSDEMVERARALIPLLVAQQAETEKRTYYSEEIHQAFLDAGAAFSMPTCGPCIGAHMGVLAEGERCLSTSNRNFPGRQGHVRSETYLCNPAVAAASAIKGHLCGPDDIYSLNGT